MSLRNVRTIGDIILRKKSRKVEHINDRIIQLLNDMGETMKSRDGVGLAAPQVGVLRRVVVIDVGDGIVEFINPEIIKSSGEIVMSEGCLSVPDRVGEVKRPERVTVKAYNRKGEEFEIEAQDYFARAVCHEIDHLDGILFLDKAANITRKE